MALAVRRARGSRHGRGRALRGPDSGSSGLLGLGLQPRRWLSVPTHRLSLEPKTALISSLARAWDGQACVCTGDWVCDFVFGTGGWRLWVGESKGGCVLERLGV